MALDISSDLDKLRADYLDGVKAILPDYFAALKQEDASVDDMRKAIDLGTKVLGMGASDKVENLPQISWVINGGTVQFTAAAAELSAPQNANVIEVPVVEVLQNAQQVPQTPPPAPVALDISVDDLDF